MCFRPVDSTNEAYRNQQVVQVDKINRWWRFKLIESTPNPGSDQYMLYTQHSSIGDMLNASLVLQVKANGNSE